MYKFLLRSEGGCFCFCDGAIHVLVKFGHSLNTEWVSPSILTVMALTSSLSCYVLFKILIVITNMLHNDEWLGNWLMQDLCLLSPYWQFFIPPPPPHTHTQIVHCNCCVIITVMIHNHVSQQIPNKYHISEHWFHFFFKVCIRVPQAKPTGHLPWFWLLIFCCCWQYAVAMFLSSFILFFVLYILYINI